MEIWKSIPGFGDHYEASSYGNIRSKDRFVKKYSGVCKTVVFQFYRGKTLNPSTKRRGYLSVHISVDGKKHTLLVHRLVLLAFFGKPNENQDGCHNNGITNDNRIENLRWDSKISNMNDKHLHGTALLAEKNPRAKISNTEAKEIFLSDEPYSILVKKYGITKSRISSIKKGHTWISVTKNLIDTNMIGDKP